MNPLTKKFVSPLLNQTLASKPPHPNHNFHFISEKVRSSSVKIKESPNKKESEPIPHQISPQPAESSFQNTDSTVFKNPATETSNLTEPNTLKFVAPWLKQTPAPNDGNPEPETIPKEQAKLYDELYYEVIYSCAKRKKNKSKSEDGIVILSLKKITLLDDRGQKVSECPNKLSFRSLRPGEVLTMASKIVEVQKKIPREEYMSGRVFIQQAAPAEVPEPVQRKIDKEKIVIPEGSFVLDQSNHIFVDKKLAEKLRPHQKEGVKFMYECLAGIRCQDNYGCILADSMGLGKSLQAVSLLYTLLRKDAVYQSFARKGVIVSPATLVGNWKQEIDKWLGPQLLNPIVCVGSGKEKKNLLKLFEQGPASLLIVSYDTFVKHASGLSKVCQVIICDEGHILKNSMTKKNSSISALACRRRVLLTGTPLQNNLTEFYACVSLVNPGVLGDLSMFNKIYAAPILKAQEPNATGLIRELALARSEELWRVTAQFILRRTGSILEYILPPRNEYLVFCKLHPLQSEIYCKLISSKFTNQTIESGNSSKALAICTLLRKLVNHSDLVYNSTSKSEELKELLAIAEKSRPNDYWNIQNRHALSSKFVFVQKIIDYSKVTSDKIVIVSSFTKTLDLLQNFCEKVEVKIFRLDGSTVAQKRMQIVNDFNSDPEPAVFLLSLKAGGCGLNLVSANRLVLFDPDWNPSNDKQAMGRVWRDGQVKPVFIYRLFMTGTIEEKIYQRQTVKEDLSKTVVDAKTVVSQFSKDYLKEIFCLNLKCSTFQKGDTLGPDGSFLDRMGEDVEMVKKMNNRWGDVKQEDMDFTEAKYDDLSSETPLSDEEKPVKMRKFDN